MDEDTKKALKKKLDALTESGDADAEKVGVLNELAEEISLEQPKDSVKVANEALELARRIDDQIGEATALGNLGFSYYLLSNHDAAMPKLLEAIAMFEKLDELAPQARALAGLAAVYHSLGDFEQALSVSHRALGLQRQIGDRNSEGWTLNGIGGAYNDMGDYDRALHFQKQSLNIFEEIDRPVGKARALNGIGTVYQSMEQYPEATDYHLRSLELFRQAQNKLGEARALNDLGVIHQRLGEYERAKECHLSALKIRDEVGNRQAKSTSLIALGNLYIETKDPDLALEVLHRALTIAMEIRAKPRIYQANLAMSQAYEAKEAFDDALHHYRIYQQVKEEVMGDQATSRIRNLQITFEVEQSQKEAEISRLKNVELKEKNDQLEALLIELKQTQIQLIQTEKMAALGSLVAGVVHELNNPLGAINSAADVSSRCVDKLIEILEGAQTIDDLRDNKELVRCLDILQRDHSVTMEASQRISRIVNSLKSFVRLDKAEFQEADVHEGLDSTVTLLEAEFKDRVEIRKEYGDVPPLRSNPGELNQVFMHLLTNAARAIEDKGTVTIRTYTKNGKVIIEFSDTGVGISPEHIARLFDPSFSRTGPRVKAGLGLFTSYNIMKKHNGDIKVESEVGKGTTFTLVLPVT